MINIQDISERSYVPAPAQREKTLAEKVSITIVIIFDCIRALLWLIPVSFKVLQDIIIPPKRKDISGQLAFVTGGANGLGREICLALAKQGCNVVIADLDLKNGERTAAECEERYKNIRAKAFKLDVTNYKDIQKLKGEINSEMGSVDILVNNAGLLSILPLQECSFEDIQLTIDVNLTSHFWTIKIFIDEMIARKRGHIVAVSSILGLLTGGEANSYTATKHALRGLMESLYDNLCVAGLGEIIHLTTVYPYFINTRKEIYDLPEKFTVLQKFNFIEPQSAAETIVEAIQRNNKSLMIPRALFPFVTFYTLLPLELMRVCKRFVARDLGKKL